jgi:hypothetical protein
MTMAEMQIYPKIVIDLETTRTEKQIRQALDDLYPDFKQRIRALVASDPKTTIVGWHYHLSTGSVDEDE